MLEIIERDGRISSLRLRSANELRLRSVNELQLRSVSGVEPERLVGERSRTDFL